MRALAVLLSLFLPCAVFAQTVDKPKVVVCKFCNNKGGKPCKAHPKGIHKLEKRAEVCSVATECEDCAGGLLHDCKICKNEAVERHALWRQKLAVEWLAARRKKVDAHLKKAKVKTTILHAKGKYTHLAFSIPPLTVGRRKVQTHELMHIYLDRIEALRAEFVKVLELTDRDFNRPIEVYMFKKQAAHMVISPRVTGLGGGSRGTGQKLMGENMVYCMWFSRQIYRNDVDVHRSVIHNCTHLLLNHMSDQEWIYNKRHGWIDAGTAHWFEYRMTGRSTNFCFEEVAISPGRGIKGGKFRVAARKYVDTRKAMSLAKFYNLNTDQLGLLEHAMSFAYVDYLITVEGGAKFRDLVRAVKKNVKTPDALKKVYGLTFFQLDKKVTRWIKKSYPTR